MNIILKGRVVATDYYCLLEIKALNLIYYDSTIQDCMQYTEALLKTKLNVTELQVLFRIDNSRILYVSIPQSAELLDLITESLDDLDDIMFDPNLIRISSF